MQLIMPSQVVTRGRLVGYARSSASDESISCQEQELRDAGCTEIYSESVCQETRRPQLEACMRDLHPGDVLVITGFLRMARSVAHLHAIARRLGDRGIFLRSLSEGFDTSVGSSRALLDFLGTLAAFEHGLAQERSRRGIASARERGREFGNPKFRSGDRDAITRMKETQDATFLDRARLRSRPWIGYVSDLRPGHSWQVVHRYVAARLPAEQVPTMETMVSIVHRLVRAGDLPRSILQRASSTRRDVADLARRIALEAPGIDAASIAAEFSHLGVAGRSSGWSPEEIGRMLSGD